MWKKVSSMKSSHQINETMEWMKANHNIMYRAIKRIKQIFSYPLPKEYMWSFPYNLFILFMWRYIAKSNKYFNYRKYHKYLNVMFVPCFMSLWILMKNTFCKLSYEWINLWWGVKGIYDSIYKCILWMRSLNLQFTWRIKEKTLVYYMIVINF